MIVHNCPGNATTPPSQKVFADSYTVSITNCPVCGAVIPYPQPTAPSPIQVAQPQPAFEVVT